MSKTFASLAWAALFPVVVGCGSKPNLPAAYEVKGTVTVGGAPLQDGIIMFESDKGFPPVTKPISNGTFAAKVPAGKMKVTISSTKPGKKMDPMGVPVSVETLRAEYNSKTKLSADISATGPNELKFDLKK